MSIQNTMAHEIGIMKYRLTAYDLAETVTNFYETNNKIDKGYC